MAINFHLSYQAWASPELAAYLINAQGGGTLHPDAALPAQAGALPAPDIPGVVPFNAQALAPPHPNPNAAAALRRVRRNARRISRRTLNVQSREIGGVLPRPTLYIREPVIPEGPFSINVPIGFKAMPETPQEILANYFHLPPFYKLDSKGNWIATSPPIAETPETGEEEYNRQESQRRRLTRRSWGGPPRNLYDEVGEPDEFPTGYPWPPAQNIFDQKAPVAEPLPNIGAVAPAQASSVESPQAMDTSDDPVLQLAGSVAIMSIRPKKVRIPWAHRLDPEFLEGLLIGLKFNPSFLDNQLEERFGNLYAEYSPLTRRGTDGDNETGGDEEQRAGPQTPLPPTPCNTPSGSTEEEEEEEEAGQVEAAEHHRAQPDTMAIDVDSFNRTFSQNPPS
ncbi:MAG: hypothetical protein M1829_005551 [Trizodia sp. TS-e1964]|nr:MAG: hypothetical protein M1829_005551 [Trizodia sp. TS-e1964]